LTKVGQRVPRLSLGGRALLPHASIACSLPPSQSGGLRPASGFSDDGPFWRAACKAALRHDAAVAGSRDRSGKTGGLGYQPVGGGNLPLSPQAGGQCHPGRLALWKAGWRSVRRGILV